MVLHELLFRRRSDVLVPAEEIGRIVLLLESSQSLVVDPVSGPDPTLALLAEVVHVHALQRYFEHSDLRARTDGSLEPGHHRGSSPTRETRRRVR